MKRGAIRAGRVMALSLILVTKGASPIVAKHDDMHAFSGLNGRNQAVVGCIYHRHGVVGFVSVP